MNSRRYRVAVVIGITLVIAGCATQYAPDRMANPYGFFSGIFHGAIFPFALTAKLISWAVSLFGISFLDSVTIIGRPNTGFFYYFGFFLGLGTFSGGSSQVGR